MVSASAVMVTGGGVTAPGIGGDVLCEIRRSQRVGGDGHGGGRRSPVRGWRWSRLLCGAVG